MAGQEHQGIIATVKMYKTEISLAAMLFFMFCSPSPHAPPPPPVHFCSPLEVQWFPSSGPPPSPLNMLWRCIVC